MAITCSKTYFKNMVQDGANNKKLCSLLLKYSVITHLRTFWKWIRKNEQVFSNNTKENSVFVYLVWDSISINQQHKVWKEKARPVLREAYLIILHFINVWTAEWLYVMIKWCNHVYGHRYNGMLRHSWGGGLIFLSLQPFIAPALDLMPSLPSRQRREALW